MGNVIQQIDELERAWKDVGRVEEWKRERKKRFRSLRQENFQDAQENFQGVEGAWDRTLPEDHGVDWGADGPMVFPREPQIKATSSKQEFILPDPEWKQGVLEYPLAKRAGVSEDQRAQAAAMFGAGLKSKAKRKAHCGLLGQRWNCTADHDHDFFMPYMCGNRYCAACGPGIFGALFSKHMQLEAVARRLVPDWPVFGHRHARVIAKIDFTVCNTGEMPTPAGVRKFNQDIRKFFRLLEARLGITRNEYGVLFCDEFGRANTNLHAHAVYAGPYLAQKKKRRELSRLFAEVVGSSGFVSIKAARSFPAALAHALKYTGKYVSVSNPARLAQLEKAFNGVRRVHALAAFYNPKAVGELKPESGSGGIEGDKLTSCPVCQAKVYRPTGWHMRIIAELTGAGLLNYWEIQRDLGQSKRSRFFGAPERAPP